MMILRPGQQVEHCTILDPDMKARLRKLKLTCVRLRPGVRNQAGKFLKYPIMVWYADGQDAYQYNEIAGWISVTLTINGTALIGELEEFDFLVEPE